MKKSAKKVYVLGKDFINLDLCTLYLDKDLAIKDMADGEFLYEFLLVKKYKRGGIIEVN